MGAIRNASNAVKEKRPPVVIVPAMIWRAPTNVTTAPTSPRSTLADKLITDVAVKVRITFSSRRLTPVANTVSFAFFGVVALNHANAAKISVSRPVTSALILPRSRKMGRMVPKAFVMRQKNKVQIQAPIKVIIPLIRTRSTKAMAEVSRPPVKSINPVPRRLRTPSTSLIMRETRLPVLLTS